MRQRGYSTFVRFEPWVAYEKRAEYFDRFALSLLTFRQSIETDLSMRTRVFDYLWGGLPVLTSWAPGTDEQRTRWHRFALAHRLTVMVDGRVLETGTPEQVRASAAVQEAYLGGAADAA